MPCEDMKREWKRREEEEDLWTGQGSTRRSREEIKKKIKEKDFIGENRGEQK